MNGLDPNAHARPATEEVSCCPNCGGQRLARWCAARDRLHKLSRQEFPYSLCGDCRLLFLSVRPREEEAHKFYPEDYGPHQAAHETEKGQAAHDGAASQAAPATSPVQSSVQPSGEPPKSFVSRAVGFVNFKVGSRFPDTFHEALEKFYNPPVAGARLLDFGCGSERFLNRAREQGWDTIGIDFAPRSVELVKRSGHQAFLMSSPVWDEIEDESLDCVRINHVLEHLYQPKEILAALARKLKAGARMHIAMPNPRGAAAALFGSRWRGLDCPRHVTLYPPATLGRLLSESGFAEVEIVYETVTKDLVGSLGYLLRDAKLVGRGGSERILRSEGLAGLFYVPARLASSLGRADVFHAFVRKA